MSRDVRPATTADFPAIADLQARYDTHWLGTPERSEAEVTEELARATSVVLATSGEELVAALWADGPHTLLAIDPAKDPRPIILALDPLITEFAGSIQVFSGDTALQDALISLGFEHRHSAFELTRVLDGSWHLDTPTWPTGVRVTDFSAADPAEVHELIYGRARWADVPGHVHRDLQNWTSTFVTDRDPADQQVLAWRGDELVGAALGRVFDDGGGWVAQLAVADSERRVGLGRAQLLEAFARRVAAGATTLGLGAQAENSGALALYTSIGLRIEREWRIFAPPP